MRYSPNLTTELTERMLTARSFLMQYYYQHPQPPEKHLFYAVCALGCQFMNKTKSMEEYALERKVGRHLREKAMVKVKELVFQRSSISAIQTLLLMAMLAPNSDSEGTSANWQSACIYSEFVGQDFRGSNWKTVYDTIREEDFDVELSSVYESAPDNYDDQVGGDRAVMDKYSSGCIPQLLIETDADIREQRPIFNSHLQIIPLAQMIGRVLLSLYIPTQKMVAAVSPANNWNGIDIDVVSNLDTALITWRQEADMRKTGFRYETGM
ncbi:hypothetical protein BDB00DRAFT_783084 [Zychaea mexicana]|uniref:uncharacterized protein n=1 Tax=Zychaea mexicana TaxID=64656 RepID=UPI0022FDD044|nr:uncharacterized protein BDB00DRAFT_783084 [Zychaea mexicana]KAI9499597.1 hypothetical protein BDB00DRAFT_783084 [Zychaea mexicana]